MVTSVAARTSVDTVPELYPYRDTGCEVSRSCLNCPLPQCKYDNPTWFQHHRRMARDFKVLNAMRSEELTVEEAAQRFSVTARTIFRILRRSGQAVPDLDFEQMEALAAD